MTLELNFLEIRQKNGRLWAVVQLVNDQDNEVDIAMVDDFTTLSTEFNENFAGNRNARYFFDTKNFEVYYTTRSLVFANYLGI